MVSPDQPIVTGHDEDGDAIIDGADNCPTVANTNQATAGELVGQACDPRMNGDGDRIGALFLFAEPGRPMELMGGQQFDLDHAMTTGGEISTLGSFTPTRVSIVVSNTNLAVGSSSIQLRIKTYQCQIGPCSGSGTYCLRAEGDNMTSETDVSLAATYRFDLDQIDDKITCRVRTGIVETTTSANAASNETDRVRVRANSVALTIDSFVVYDTPP